MAVLLTPYVMPLLAAHLIVDFLIQTDEVAGKKRRFSILLRHSLHIGVVSYLLLGIVEAWPVALVMLVSHLLIDSAKSRAKKVTLRVFLADQAAHLTVILGACIFIVESRLYAAQGLWLRLIGREYYRYLLVLAGLIVAVKAVSIVIRLMFQSLDLPHERVVELRGGGGITDGGRIIGYLERSLIYIFVLAGQPGAIGFLIAAKSVFRFGDVRDRNHRTEAEYIIIGTLSSFLFGIAVAYSVRHYLSTI